MQNDRGSGGFETIVLVLAAIAAFLSAIVWAGATLALAGAGNPQLPAPADSLRAAAGLAEQPGRPDRAWPTIGDALPGPVLYWTCTAVVALAVLVGLAVGYRRWSSPRTGTTRRRPLGIDARAAFAHPTELTTLIVPGPVRGRFILGRVGRHLVATETPPPRTDPNRGRQWRPERRRGDRGAVALIGPSRSGKTTAAIGGILEWDGPAVLSSVKGDLLATTHAWRSHIGDIEVFDPTASVPASTPGTARWSPIAQATTTAGAQRAARTLCDAAPRSGVEGGMDFWLAQTEILLSGLLFVAHHTGVDMGTVATWILRQDRPGDLGPGDVRLALDLLSHDPSDIVADHLPDATTAITGIWAMEERTRSSVYATAQTVIWPWSDPGVAASSRGQSINLPWLLNGSNTVYLCAPIEDQRRLAPAFGGLLNDLINQAYRHVALTGEPIDPPLLIVIDEAGNTPLRSLPEYASTLAGLGILLVTIWQSVAQIEAAYGKAGDTILTNHLSKVFYAGLSDPASLRYITTVLGDAEVETRSRTATHGPGVGSSQWSTTRNPLAPAHALRQMRPGDALLLHGTLPPAHLRTRPYYRDRGLAARANHAPSEE
jgi:type IV secretion system protein VirD4